MPGSRQDALSLFADGLALVYHEARHVRHLLRGGHLPPEGWEQLRSLPTNRVSAWEAIRGIREEAALKESVSEAARLFERRFGKSLVDLVELFRNPNWKHAYAGHAWMRVAERLIDLANAIDSGDQSLIGRAIESFVGSRHNTGWIRDKIAEFDDEIDAQASIHWLGPAGS